MAVIAMDPPAATSPIKPEECERLYGGSIKVCRCRLAHPGGWLPCPIEARGELGPAPPAVLAPRTPTTTLISQPSREAPPMTGELCHACQTFSMIRTGTCLTCQLCGDTSGGCS